MTCCVISISQNSTRLLLRRMVQICISRWNVWNAKRREWLVCGVALFGKIIHSSHIAVHGSASHLRVFASPSCSPRPSLRMGTRQKEGGLGCCCCHTLTRCSCNHARMAGRHGAWNYGGPRFAEIIYPPWPAITNWEKVRYTCAIKYIHSL